MRREPSSTEHLVCAGPRLVQPYVGHPPASVHFTDEEMEGSRAVATWPKSQLKDTELGSRSQTPRLGPLALSGGASWTRGAGGLPVLYPRLVQRGSAQGAQLPWDSGSCPGGPWPSHRETQFKWRFAAVWLCDPGEAAPLFIVLEFSFLLMIPCAL